MRPRFSDFNISPSQIRLPPDLPDILSGTTNPAGSCSASTAGSTTTATHPNTFPTSISIEREERIQLSAMASVDFLLKGCETNVFVVEDLGKMKWNVLRPRQRKAEEEDTHRLELNYSARVLRELRRSGLLCAPVADAVDSTGTVVCFNSALSTSRSEEESEAQMSEILDRIKRDDRGDYAVIENGSVGEDLNKSVDDAGGGGLMVRDVLIDAILTGLSFTLARQDGQVLRVGQGTWVYDVGRQDGGEEGGGTLLRVQINLNDSGLLYISTSTERSSLGAVSHERDVKDGECVLLAPSGQRARVVVDVAENEVLSGRRKIRIDGEAWRRSGLDSLAAEGIEVSLEEGWIHVEIAVHDNDEKKVVAWPRCLCLTDRSKHQSKSQGSETWKHWLAPTTSSPSNLHAAASDIVAYKDPIAQAESFFLESSSVAATAEGNAAETSVQPEASANTNETMIIESPFATSPPFNQRLMDQQAAMSGIYPTPPDGLLPAHMVTPNANVTSDIPSEALQESLHPDTGSRLLGSDDNIQNDGRGHSFSAEPQGMDVVDLFGDGGGLDDDAFGGNEVGDADFDYFDDGPDDGADTLVEMEDDAEMGDGTSPAETLAAMPQPEGDDGEDHAVKFDVGEDTIPAAEVPEQPVLSQVPVIDNDAVPTTSAVDLSIQIDTQHHPPPDLLGTPQQFHDISNGPLTTPNSALPPPEPTDTDVSATQPPRTSHLRRKSTFDPMAFDKEMDLSAKYGNYSQTYGNHSSVVPNIGLPRKRRRGYGAGNGEEELESEDDDDDDDEGSESSMGVDGDEDRDSGYSGLPWETKKRRRPEGLDNGYTPGMDVSTDAAAYSISSAPMMSSADIDAVLAEVLKSSATRPNHDRDRPTSDAFLEASEDLNELLPPIETVHEQLEPLDLIYIAQLVAEQAVTCTRRLVNTLHDTRFYESDSDEAGRCALRATTIDRLARQTISHILPQAHLADVKQLALVKEPPPRPTPTPTPSSSTSGQAQAQGRMSHPQPQPHLPKNHPRAVESSTASASGSGAGGVNFGPDIFAIPPPFVRVQRGGAVTGGGASHPGLASGVVSGVSTAGARETYDILPTSLPFWTELGLAPASGGKDVSLLAVMPDSGDDLVDTVKTFLEEAKRAWEGGKFGRMGFVESFEGEGEEVGIDGVVGVKVESREEGIGEVLRGYARECGDLGRRLAKIADVDPRRTIVIIFVNVFGETERAKQHLCACFWMLWKSYRDNFPNINGNGGNGGRGRTDVALQILPIDLITDVSNNSNGGFGPPVILRREWMDALAMEMYDRLPPQAQPSPATRPSSLGVADPSSEFVAAATRSSSAPAVEITPTLPRKINFALSADPPPDLLHEGSILHLAYAVSRDTEWMSVFWCDSTGGFRRDEVFCQRGRGWERLVEEVWDVTLGVLREREIVWRVFVAGWGFDGKKVGMLKEDIEVGNLREVWKDVVSRRSVRRQALHVTFLEVDGDDVSLQLCPATAASTLSVDATKAPTTNEATATTPATAALLQTPVSTPQAANFTVSPSGDGSSGGSGLQNNAPPTPAPSDSVASILENDPEAHLVDTMDETWGMLLAPSFAKASRSKSQVRRDLASDPTPSSSTSNGLATGFLFQRGATGGASAASVAGFAGVAGAIAGTSPTTTRRFLDSLRVELFWDIRIRPNRVIDEGQQRQGEATLREVLRMFRGLGVFTRARMGVGGGSGGCGSGRREREGGCGMLMPWHLFCARQGARSVEGFLGKGGGV